MADVVWPKLGQADLEQIAPLKSGRPDTYQFLPSRFITMAEAKARGWAHFYIGDVCSYGHKAPRFTTNPRSCVDCRRIKKGKATIGGKGEAEYVQRKRPYRQRGTSDTSSAAVGTGVASYRAAIATLEPDPLEKRFLKAYADCRDFDAAAREVGKTMADFQARMSFSKPFRESITFLEEQYGLSHTLALNDDFEWDADKRTALLRTYINTGDLATAISVIGCSNWHFEQEVNSNSDFASKLEQAETVAHRHLERVAISLATKGNDKLLQRVMAAKLPEYRDHVRVDMNVTEKLTDAQILERLLLIFERAGVPVINAPATVDAEFIEHESQAALAAPADDGDDDPEGGTESNNDLL